MDSPTTINLLQEIRDSLSQISDKLSKPPAEKKQVLVARVVVTASGTPVQLPRVTILGGEARLSTPGNTGNIYLADSPSMASSGTHRFAVSTDTNQSYTIPDNFELSSLWLDADNDSDALEIFALIGARNA